MSEVVNVSGGVGFIECLGLCGGDGKCMLAWCMPICLGAGERLCQIVLSIWNSLRALVVRIEINSKDLYS